MAKKEPQPMQAVEAAEYSDGETEVSTKEKELDIIPEQDLINEEETGEKIQTESTGIPQPVGEPEEIEPEVEELLDDITDESIEQEVKKEPAPEQNEREIDIIPEKEKKSEYQPTVKGAPDIQKLFETPVEEYGWNQFQQDAFDEKGEPKKGGIYEAAFAKYNRAEAQRGTRAEQQNTEAKTDLRKIEKDYPELWQNSGNDFISSLGNATYYSVEMFWNMFLEKTGQRPVSSGMSRSMNRVNKNLHKRSPTAAVTGKVVKKEIIQKSEERVQAEQDTGEDLSLPRNF